MSASYPASSPAASSAAWGADGQPAFRGAAAVAATLPNTYGLSYGALGDSITDRNSGIITVGPPQVAATRADGYATMANILGGHRFRMARSDVHGFSGATSPEIADEVDAIVAATACPVFFNCVGSNDLNGGVGRADAMAAWQYIVEAEMAEGILPIFLLIPPRTSASWNDANAIEAEVRNEMIRTLPIQYDGRVIVIDQIADMIEFPGGVPRPKSGMVLSDGTHPTYLSGWSMGQRIADAFDPQLPASRRFLGDLYEAYDAEDAPHGVFTPNPTMAGTAGTVTSPATGQVPTSWRIVRSGSGNGACAASVIAAPAGYAQAQSIRLTCTPNPVAGTATQWFLDFGSGNITTSLELGATYIMFVDLLLHPTDSLQFLTCDTQDRTTNGNQEFGHYAPSAGYPLPVITEETRLTFVTEPITLIGTTGIQCRLRPGILASGTIPAVIDVLELGAVRVD